jgi:hypothetical protein
MSLIKRCPDDRGQIESKRQILDWHLVSLMKRCPPGRDFHEGSSTQGFWNWLSGHPGHMSHSCGQVSATCQLSTGQLMIWCCCSKWFDVAVHQRPVGDGQYFWWASKIWDPGCPGTTTPLLAESLLLYVSNTDSSPFWWKWHESDHGNEKAYAML